MGATQGSCGGEHNGGAPPPIDPFTVRVVLCRPGPYSEGFIDKQSIHRDPPDGVVAFADEECALSDPLTADSCNGGTPIATVNKGDKLFILQGEVAKGAAGLRFGLGDRVACNVSTDSGMAWMPGTVVGLWYHEEHWRRVAPYQIRLDGDPGQYIFAPHDDGQLIKAHDDRPLACGLMPLGSDDGEDLADGCSVVYTGGGRFGGDVPMLKEWKLCVGAAGTVMKYHGRNRARGVWPVDVLFRQPGGASGVPLALTARDVRVVAGGGAPTGICERSDARGAALSPEPDAAEAGRDARAEPEAPTAAVP